MRSWWVMNETETYGCLSAETYEKADAALFLGICQAKYPCDAVLVETLPAEEREIEDEDIISVEVDGIIIEDNIPIDLVYYAVEEDIT